MLRPRIPTWALLRPRLVNNYLLSPRLAPSTGRQTITLTAVTENVSTTDGTSVSSASFTPDANVLYLVAVASSFSAAPATPTCSGAGITWTAVSGGTSTISSRRLTWFYGWSATPSAGALTFDFGAETELSFAWAVIKAAGAALEAPVQVKAVAATAALTTSVVFNSALENAKNVALLGVVLNNNTTVTQDSDFAELTDRGTTANVMTLQTEWAVNQTQCDPTFISSSSAAVMLEIKAAA